MEQRYGKESMKRREGEKVAGGKEPWRNGVKTFTNTHTPGLD